MAFKHLSEDFLVEIFSRLPAKSVGRCRCLSKLWSTYLSTTEFIQKHLINRQKSLHKQENLIFVKRHPPYSLVTITGPMMKHEVSREVVNLSNEWDSIVGSCNGLVLLATQQRHKLLLINAVTLQQVDDIPRSLTDYELLGVRQVEWFCVGRSFGFGYDHVNDDYKIVSISLYNNDVDSKTDTFIQVYSVKKGVWKSVESKSSVEIVLDSIRPGVLVNGSVHWPTGIFSTSSEDHSVVIAAFDLATESFHAIHLPYKFPSWRKKIFSLGGCLCMTIKVSSDMIELWMMKEYGVVESWCSFRICANGLGDGAALGLTRGGFELLCFVGDVNVLGVDTEYRWSSFELNEGTVKEVSIGGGVEADFLDGVAFVDSLVSPGHRASGC